MHEARHTYASLMIAAESDNPKTIQKLMWATGPIPITYDLYGHLLNSAQETAADKLGTFLTCA